ncbi:MAG: 3'(2'),5'-bisphosphate nucleotidase CysQ [Paracoccaceae bacterium]
MPESDLALLTRAAFAAGAEAMRWFRGSFTVRDKGGAEGPVTEADIAVNDLLAGLLRAARPDYGWLSEETPDDPARLSCERVFILDPIDGTRAFIEGHAGFAHSLAVAEGGRVTAGVVFLPARNILYAAEAEGVATRDGVPIRPSARDGPEGATLLATKSILAPEHWRDGRAPEVSRHFRPSLASRLCLVADGGFDAMLTLRPAWEWDIAAGSLIAERAGVRVTDRRGGALRFNTPGARADGVLAAGEGVWRGISERLAPG